MRHSAVVLRAIVLWHGAAAFMPAAAADAPHWVCTDAQGHKSIQDRPCAPGSTGRLLKPQAVVRPEALATPRPVRADTTAPSTADPRQASSKGPPTLASLAAMVFGAAVLFALLERWGRRRSRSPRAGRHARSLALRDPWPDPEVPPRPSPQNLPRQAPPTAWSLGLIREIEWKRFEELVQGIWRAQGYQAELTSIGADGGVDVMIYSGNSGHVFAIAQCKHWKDQVGVANVRELWGLVHHHGAKLGLFYGLSGFTPDAQAFARDKHLKLITGADVLRQIHALSDDKQQSLLAQVCRGDYRTPTCSRCDVKMVRRNGERGEFWGCANFPRCHQRMY